jgi:type I restriction enzyme M protein
MLSNPPFGVEWKKVEKEVRKEHEPRALPAASAPACRACPTAPCCSCCTSSARCAPPPEGGSRFGIVLNGSPLFTGGAGSGESEIRRYVLENDLLEAIVGLPTDMFYNTGIATYVWIISNRKPEARKGKVQLIDASGMWQKMRKSLGSKRKELSDAHIERITRLFGDFAEAHDEDGTPISRIFDNEAFGYHSITVERPLRDAKRATSCWAKKASKKASPSPTPAARHRERAAGRRRGEYFRARCCPTRPTPGSTPTRPRWATKSRSTGTSTCSSPRARWPRSTPS